MSKYLRRVWEGYLLCVFCCAVMLIIITIIVFLQHWVHVSLWAAGPEGLLCGAAADLPHPLHRGTWLHQRHGDVHHLGRWRCRHRLGQAAGSEDSPAGQNPSCGAEQCHGRLAATCSPNVTGRAVRQAQTEDATCTAELKDTWTINWHTHAHTHANTSWFPGGFKQSLHCGLINGHWAEENEETLGRGPARLWPKLYLFPFCGQVKTSTAFKTSICPIL